MTLLRRLWQRLDYRLAVMDGRGKTYEYCKGRRW